MRIDLNLRARRCFAGVKCLRPGGCQIEAWECRATLDGQPYGVGVGLLVGSGTGVAGNTPEQFFITSAQLALGEGVYRISVYVKKDNIWYGG